MIESKTISSLRKSGLGPAPGHGARPVSGNIIVILAVMAAFLLPASLFAGETPSAQPVPAVSDNTAPETTPAAVTTPDKAAPETGDVKAQPGTAETSDDAAAEPAPPDAPVSQKAQAPSEFIHSDETMVLPAGGTAAVPQAGPPAVALQMTRFDRNLLTTKSPYSEEIRGSVARNIHIFTSDLRSHFSDWLARSGRYIGLMKSIFRENCMPEDLVFLSLVESGFNPRAYSWAKASGPWQFMKGTGRKYGLRIDRWVDERRDPVKSTEAAAAYLKDLYDMFGTWSLALASYNAGEGNVARAVNYGGTLDFWKLRQSHTLPRETKEYVPKFLAAQIIADNPGQFGFSGLEYEAPLTFDEVVVNKPVSLNTVAKCCGVSVDEIKDLNPELIRWCTPPNTPDYTLRIPKGDKDVFLASYASMPEASEAVEKRYIVRRGDTLRRIAARLGTTPAAIRSANGIRRLRVGQRLSIPPDAGLTADSGGTAMGHAHKYRVRGGDTLSRIAMRHRMSTRRLAAINGLTAHTRLRKGQVILLASRGPIPHKTRSGVRRHCRKKVYRVKKGDTLWTIAQRFGVSVRRLVKMNSMGRRPVIRVGQRLVIPASETA